MIKSYGTRRAFLMGAVGVAAATLLPAVAFAKPRPSNRLSLLNLHTGERSAVDYRIDGQLQPEALRELDKVLRDHRTGDTIKMDRELFDLLDRLSAAMDTDREFHVISGYRSPKTNAMLAGRSSGVAKKSYHTRGMAIDIRMPGRDLNHLHRAARSLKVGGVGKYSRSNFVHVDTGRVRYW